MVFEKMFQIVLLLAVTMMVNGHIAAWSKGMYCLNGTTPGEDNGNNNDPVSPLFQLKKEDWWMHHINKCDEFPPAPGDFLELPANGEFTVELATNRAFTTLTDDGKKAGAFPGPLTGGIAGGLASVAKAAGEIGTFKIGEEGADHEVAGCIVDPNMHTQNETMASGTAFAISYTSELDKVTPENLVVFTVLEHTPFKRLATYQVPDLPACPEGGCICTWGWIPNGCGQPNMYMLPYRCKVTGTPGSRPLALPARPPQWCDSSLPPVDGSDASTSASTKQDKLGPCLSGPKQMLFWNQLEGDNIETLDGELGESLGSPAYNDKVGFKSGAQTDIFGSDGEVPPVKNTPTPPVSDSGSVTSVATTTAETASTSAVTSSETMSTSTILLSSATASSTLTPPVRASDLPVIVVATTVQSGGGVPPVTNTPTSPVGDPGSVTSVASTDVEITSTSAITPSDTIPLTSVTTSTVSASIVVDSVPTTTSLDDVTTSAAVSISPAQSSTFTLAVNPLPSSPPPTMTTIRVTSQFPTYTSTSTSTAQSTLRNEEHSTSGAIGLNGDHRTRLGFALLSGAMIGLTLAL